MDEDIEAVGRQILSRIDELHFLSSKAGVYDTLDLSISERTDDGEPVSGPWIMETLKALQVDAGLV